MNIEKQRKYMCHLCGKRVPENKLMGHVSSCVKKRKSKPTRELKKDENSKIIGPGNAKNKKRVERREEAKKLAMARANAYEQKEQLNLRAKTNIIGQRAGFHEEAKIPGSNIRKIDK